MKIKQIGYIKLHRKFLQSQVHRLNGAAFRLFIDLLLLADAKGQVETSYSELKEILNINSHHTIKTGLEELKRVDAINYKSEPNLEIQLKNWGAYQYRNTMAKNAIAEKTTDYGKNCHTTMAKSAIDYGKNCHTHNNRVPVPITKEYKNIFKNSKSVQERKLKMLNFQTPQTDLEKLIRFYLEGTRHPALKKPNNNDLLNIAVQNDIPHFKTILANCDDLEQAKKCVKKYVSEAKGAYSMFYLAGMINSIRQEVESRENKRHE